ncbi:MAG: hypothetical protein KF805_08425 [Phycisphaeraceae bacterium]|nr:hypothetical protein [Phycisphaeraceae bacterium]
MPLKKLRIDRNKRDNGTIVPYFQTGVKLRIASALTPEFKAERSRLLGPFRDRIESGTIDDAEIVKILAPAYARYILLGWEGDDEAYTYEGALEALRDPDLEDLYQFVRNVADSLGIYRREEEEQAAKN